MGRKTKLLEKTQQEWERKANNIGSHSTYPFSVVLTYLEYNEISDIVESFWDESVQEVTILDFVVLTQYWWLDQSIQSARYSWFYHSKHHVSQYIFDKANTRLSLEMRQPDLDGKHWKDSHLHIRKGKIDPNNLCNIVHRTYKSHLKICRHRALAHFSTKVHFIMKVHD